MEIIATSDLHGTLPEIQPCDLLIVAGDVCPVYDHNRVFQAQWLRDNFTKWLKAQPAKNIVWTPGNHDFVLDDSAKLRAEMTRVADHIHFLVDREVKIDSVRIYATPWTPHLPNWAFAAEDGPAAEEKFSHIPAALDILISHGPPVGCADRVSRAGHVGSVSLKEAIIQKNPNMIICGHIHEGYGYYEFVGRDLYNVALNDEFYEPRNQPVRIHY